MDTGKARAWSVCLGWQLYCVGASLAGDMFNTLANKHQMLMMLAHKPSWQQTPPAHLLNVVPISIQRAICIKRDQPQCLCRRMDLRNVQDVPELCKVWWDVLAARQVEECIVFPEGICQPQRGEE
jgi:hypothetical protein